MAFLFQGGGQTCRTASLHRGPFPLDHSAIGKNNIYDNKEEKLLRHVAMVAKFLDDNKPRKSPKILILCYFKLHRSYSISFNLANLGEIFIGIISVVT